MAMFPNATKGYMPFVAGKAPVTGKATLPMKNKRSRHHHVNGGKLNKSENRLGLGTQKMYQVTLRDKKGRTYKYIVKTDGSRSLPELCESKITLKATHSMPQLGTESTPLSPSKQRKILAEKVNALQIGENFSTSMDLRECGKKEGILSSIIRFIKEKTGSKKSEKKLKCGKSKRRPKDLAQRKRQRTVSAMSNLDPIEESPNEHEYEDESDDDSDSYTHYASSLSSDSDVSSVASSICCSVEVTPATSSS